jgi:cation diffusion facilitator CzcD-associated flavoprotein CzcO
VRAIDLLTYYRLMAAPTIAIIGAGLGGIAAGVHLKRAGILSFTIFEQSAGPGGTWWDNTYPGAGCDVEIVFYQYSFMPRTWKRTHASQAEIQAYVQEVIDAFGLAPHIRYNTRVDSAVWDDERHFHTVTTASGEVARYDVVVAALGLLNVPRYPDWPGLESFAGPKFHTARWEHAHDLAGKHVAVVGTGSTAAQVVPAIAPVAGRVTMFSREPAYVLPKNERDLTPKEARRLRHPLGRWLARARILWGIERAVAVRNPASRQQREAREAFARYRDGLFEDRPDLREAMSPDYPYACKRPVLSTDLFPALLRDNVRLVPRAVTAVTPTAVVDSDGVVHPVDVLVLATGFRPWSFLHTLKVIGRGGRSIHDVWGDEPKAFLGMQVPGFPNFFVMYGPNTNFYCVTFMLERQAEFIARAVRRMACGRATALEVHRWLLDAYNGWLDRSLAGKTLEANCSNYYHSASGRNVVTFPWWGTMYALLARLGGFGSYARRAAGRAERGSA